MIELIVESMDELENQTKENGEKSGVLAEQVTGYEVE